MKKLTDQELQKIESIQSQYTSLIYSLGQTELELISINKIKSKIQTDLEQIEKMESAFTKELKNKYGDVSINTKTGEITKI